MFEGLTTNALSQLAIVEQMIGIHETALRDKDAQARKRIKVYAASSCVTNLYAIYEGFVESAIAEYLDAIPELVRFANLPGELRTEYRIGISHILSRIDSERYSHLVHENIIRWYHEALNNNEKYQFISEAITRHEQNLRLNSLESLLAKIRLTELGAWLNKSPEIKSLYDANQSIKEQLEAELKIFIQIRNDAAHGGLDDLDGTENLQRHCTLVKALIKSISAYMHKSLLEQRALAGKCRSIGQVTEVLPKSGAFIAQLNNTSTVEVGMTMHFMGDNYCFSKTVDTIQVDSKPVEKIISNKDGFEVGMGCQVLPRMSASIYVDA